MELTAGRKATLEEYNAMWQQANLLLQKGAISQEEMDITMARIARESDLIEVVRNASNQAGSAERTITILPADPNMKLSSPWKHPAPVVKPAPALTSKDICVSALSVQTLPKYISLTKLAQSHHMDNPSYAIQSWMRSENTLAFLDLWERENNPAYDTSAYAALLEKKKSTSFTMTAKQWIEQTKAIGITSKQGKQGGTYAHLMIAGQFATWLSPDYMMRMLKMAELEDDFFKAGL